VPVQHKGFAVLVALNSLATKALKSRKNSFYQIEINSKQSL